MMDKRSDSGTMEKMNLTPYTRLGIDGPSTVLPSNDNSEQSSTTLTLPARGGNLDEATSHNPRATATRSPKPSCGHFAQCEFCGERTQGGKLAPAGHASEQWRSHCAKQRVV